MKRSIERSVRDDEELPTTIANAVADVRGVDPIDLPPLYDEVDLDAIGRLFGGPEGERDTDLSVVVEVAGCEVTISEGRTVYARRLTAADERRGSRTAPK